LDINISAGEQSFPHPARKEDSLSSPDTVPTQQPLIAFEGNDLTPCPAYVTTSFPRRGGKEVGEYVTVAMDNKASI